MELALQIKSTGVITANFDEYNAWLDEGLKKYQGIVVTEEQIPDCKKMRAELNKIEKAINSRKVEIKKEFLKPYTEFEEQTKALMKKVSDCSQAIDNQIKAFEEKEKADKYDRIKTWWQENGELVPFEKVYDSRLLQKGVTEKGWQDALNAKVQSFREDVKIIEGMDAEQKAFMMNDYVITLSLAQSMANWQFYQEQKRRIEEQMKAEEKPVEPAKPIAIEPKPEEKKEEVQKVTFEMDMTDSQIQAVRNLLDRMGVKYYISYQHSWDDGLPF